MTRAVLAVLVIAAMTHPAVAQGDREALAGEPPPPDDLSQAADATADVAAIPTPEAAPASKASSDDIDLGSLGLDPAGQLVDDKLNIYGFADFSYVAQRWNRHPPQDSRTFVYGNLNLYMARNLTQRARVLAEVRFTFLPNGTMNRDGTFVETAAQDPADYGRTARWGGIVIERAYAEYDVTDHLTIRGGHWLTPYGIWNTDHGSPVIVGTNRPYIIGQQTIPQYQTGLDMFGSYDAGRFRVGGHLTASNGRGATESQTDRDNKLAFGGRLELETPWGLKAGGSYYRGRYTGLPPAAGAPAETYAEVAYAGDAMFDLGGLHLQAEVVARYSHYLTPPVTAMGPSSADPHDFGVYVLGGYRFDRLWNVMPYFYGEDRRPGDHAQTSRVLASNIGLNFRPVPSLVLKVQWSYVWFANDVGFLAGHRSNIYAAQASWVF